MRRLRPFRLVLVLAVVAGGGAGAISAQAAQTQNVAARDVSLTFNPKTSVITVGDTVHWSGSDQHTTTSDPNQAEQWDSGSLKSSGFDHTFNTPGTFTYHCSNHQAEGMVGKVVVEQAGGTQPEALPKVSFKARTLRSSKRGVLKLRVRNPNAFPITGKVRLDTARRVTLARKRKLKLGSARFQIDAGQTKTVRLKMSKLARRTLKRHHKLKVNATFVAGTAGQAARKTVKRGVTVKAPKGS